MHLQASVAPQHQARPLRPKMHPRPGDPSCNLALIDNILTAERERVALVSSFLAACAYRAQGSPLLRCRTTQKTAPVKPTHRAHSMDPAAATAVLTIVRAAVPALRRRPDWSSGGDGRSSSFAGWPKRSSSTSHRSPRRRPGRGRNIRPGEPVPYPHGPALFRPLSTGARFNAQERIEMRIGAHRHPSPFWGQEPQLNAAPSGRRL